MLQIKSERVAGLLIDTYAQVRKSKSKNLGISLVMIDFLKITDSLENWAPASNNH